MTETGVKSAWATSRDTTRMSAVFGCRSTIAGGHAAVRVTGEFRRSLPEVHVRVGRMHAVAAEQEQVARLAVPQPVEELLAGLAVPASMVSVGPA